MYLSYVIYVIIAFMSNVIITSNSGFGGGSVGMTPFYQFLISIPLVIISSLVYFVGKRKDFVRNNYMACTIIPIINLIALLPAFGYEFLVKDFFKHTVLGVTSRAYLGGIFIGTSVILLIEHFYQRRKKVV